MCKDYPQFFFLEVQRYCLLLKPCKWQTATKLDVKCKFKGGGKKKAKPGKAIFLSFRFFKPCTYPSDLPVPGFCVVLGTYVGVSGERGDRDGVLWQSEEVRGETSVNHSLAADLLRHVAWKIRRNKFFFSRRLWLNFVWLHDTYRRRQGWKLSWRWLWWALSLSWSWIRHNSAHH